MVSPKDFFKNRCDNETDIAILDILYTLRGCTPLSARELTSELQYHSPTDERTVRNHLDCLNESGDIRIVKREASGERGRAPEVCCLSDEIQAQLNEYLEKKNMKFGYRLDGIIEK